MSTISSTTSAIERAPSENTKSGWAPSPFTRTLSFMRTSGINWPRYCTIWRPFDSSMVRASTSSSRVISDSGTALACDAPARNTKSEVACSAGASRRSASAVCAAAIWLVTALPIACAMPLGSTIMITEPSPRMVLPENIAMWRSLLDIGLTTISSVWNTPSTTTPKVWLPTWATTM